MNLDLETRLVPLRLLHKSLLEHSVALPSFNYVIIMARRRHVGYTICIQSYVHSPITLLIPRTTRAFLL
jgi:hypothetical protein